MAALPADDVKAMELDDIPVQVIDGLYIGSYLVEQNKSRLLESSITHVLQVAEGMFPHFPLQFNYMNIQAQDTPQEDLVVYFPKCFEFIDCAVNTGGSVLVHCAAGISRSATVVLGYLMGRRGMSLDEATQHLRSVRPWVKPNEGFVQQLTLYQELGRDMTRWRAWQGVWVEKERVKPEGDAVAAGGVAARVGGALTDGSGSSSTGGGGGGAAKLGGCEVGSVGGDRSGTCSSVESAEGGGNGGAGGGNGGLGRSGSSAAGSGGGSETGSGGSAGSGGGGASGAGSGSTGVASGAAGNGGDSGGSGSAASGSTAVAAGSRVAGAAAAAMPVDVVGLAGVDGGSAATSRTGSGIEQLPGSCQHEAGPPAGVVAAAQLEGSLLAVAGAAMTLQGSGEMAQGGRSSEAVDSSCG